MKHSISAFALIALTGCAFVQGQVAADSEEILAQAGFQRSPLDQPGLPSRQLVEDAGSYKFADPDFCRCVYLGGAKEYAELQRLRAARLAERQWIQGRMASSNSIDRTLWGPWNPEGLNMTTDTSRRAALH